MYETNGKLQVAKSAKIFTIDECPPVDFLVYLLCAEPVITINR
jgi:hypothetical protein